MKGKRLWQTLRMYSILEPVKRTEYLRKKKVFAELGENCSIEDRVIPLYAKCIRIGNNVRLASHVLLVTHDVSCFVLNNLGIKKADGKRFEERIGCIDIGNNVFVGTNSTILYDVKIGNNVIIGAGSVVNRDIPDNSVAVGVPAKVICSFDEFVEKRRKDIDYPRDIATNNQRISDDLIAWCWKQFNEKRTPSKEKGDL
jgi:acetyltransferase-like isoleucine patch superfamily enzyme